MDDVVAVSGLRKSFGQTRALDGLDLTVRTGEVHGFLGPNGAGKTTTLRCSAPIHGRRQFSGIACSDRWCAYNAFEPECRQVCWSHLLRDFTAHAEGSAAQKDFGEAGLRTAERLFAAWQQFQQDSDRPALKHAIAPLTRELRTLLETHARKCARHRHTRTFATTCSRSGRRCGRSPSLMASSRRTTLPSAACAARSSTASSRSAANPSRASARSNGCCPSPRPAGCSAARLRAQD